MKTLSMISGRVIGPGHPCFIIAEIGVNHNGDISLAERLVDAAVAAGADAVKFQTFRADRLVVRATPTAAYQATNTGEADQHALLKPLELDEAAHRYLLDYCARRGIVFLSSPFDLESIDLLDRLDVPAFKVPSPDCVSIGYLSYMGAKRRPVILSTGMCDIGEVGLGVETLRAAGTSEIAVLHCTSCYPAPIEELNLAVIPAMAAALGLPIGYSDHSHGIAVAIAAVALGAVIIEKHVTLDKTLPGPDHKASLEPDEFKAMVDGIRSVERAVGSPVKQPQPCEASARALGRRSLATARALSAGHRLQAGDLILLRPGTGLAPRLEVAVLGRSLSHDVAADCLLSWDDLA